MAWPTNGKEPFALSGDHAVADLVRLGTATARAAGGDDIRRDVQLPVIVPLLGHGNVVWEASADYAALARRAILVCTTRVLAATAHGRVALQVFDPLLRGDLTGFARLRQSDRTLFESIATGTDALHSSLHQAIDHVRAASEATAHHEHGPAPNGQDFRLFVVFDFPKNFDEQAADQLRTLMASGPRHGLSFLIHHDPGISPAGHFTVGELTAPTTTFRLTRDAAHWDVSHELAVTFDPVPPPATVARLVEVIGDQSRVGAAPRLPLAQLLPGKRTPVESSAAGLTIPIGRTSGGQPLHLTLGSDLEQRHNVVITGAVGQGKSNLLSVIIHALAARYSPAELELHLLDFKDGVTFYPLAPTSDAPDWLPHVRTIGVESDRQFGAAMLEHLHGEFARRARMIKPHGDSLQAYRRALPDARMPRLVAIIDEFHVLFEEEDQLSSRAAQLLERLARRGRAYGIHLILASQTISGINALVAKEGGIFAQFPIRIALRNSASESRAILAPDNLAAAELRFRGEAIYNPEFGQLGGNSRMVVASADREITHDIRLGSWNAWRQTVTPPRVFDGSQPLSWAELVPALREQRLAHAPGRRLAMLGEPVAVEARPVGTALRPEPGRHLAVVGNGVADGHAASDPEAADLSVGILQLAAVSLALQHPEGDADFALVELPPHGDSPRWSPVLAAVLEDLGFPVEHVDREGLVPTLRNWADECAQPRETTRYVVAFGLDRAGPLSRVDETMLAPVEALRTILADGPTSRTHLLASWTSVQTFKGHLGFAQDAGIDCVVAMRLDQRAVTDLMGYTAEWAAPANRGLLLDRIDIPEPAVVVPPRPLKPADRQLLRRTDWSAP